MPKKINLRQNKVQKNKQQVGTYGTQTPLSSTAVERGSTRWLNGSTVVIEGLLDVAGTATVSGLLSVTGTFNASGQINLSGSTGITGPLNITGTTTIGGNTNITGELNVTGPTTLDGILDIGGDTTISGTLDIQGDTTITGDLDVDGPTTITGTLGIEGVTTLKNDLNVTTGGKIKAGNLEIEPANGGQINFLNGSLASGSQGILLNNTIGVELLGPKVKLSASLAETSSNLKVGGQAEVIGQLLLRGIPTAGSSSFTPNMYVDSNGRVYRTPWTPA